MIVLVLSVIAVICFVVGVSLLWKVLQEAPRPDQYVPRLEYDQHRQQLEQALQAAAHAKSEAQRLQGELTAARNHLETTQKDADRVLMQLKETEQKSQQEQARFQQQIERLQGEMTSIQTEKESYQAQASLAPERIKDLENQIAEIIERANAQANGSIEIINTLQQQLTQLQHQEQAYQEKVSGLQETVAKSQEFSQQLEELHRENARLQEENQGLQVKCQGEIVSLQEMEARLNALRQENDTLESRLKSQENRTQIFEQESQHLKDQLLTQEREIAQRIQELERERSLLASKLNQSASTGIQETEELRKMNQQLSEQSRLAQTELVKARARAQGLERICADYQAQLEEMLSKAQDGAANA